MQGLARVMLDIAHKTHIRDRCQGVREVVQTPRRDRDFLPHRRTLRQLYSNPFRHSIPSSSVFTLVTPSRK